MADTKVSGSRRTTQHLPDAPASETPQPPSRYVGFFHATAPLNQADQVIAPVSRVKRLGLFKREFPGRCVKTCRPSSEELRAGAIFDITEDFYLRAHAQCARFGCMLGRWENKVKDPSDVLLGAERLKQKLQKKATQEGAGSGGILSLLSSLFRRMKFREWVRAPC
jgi:hypothetical protein